MTMKKLAVGCLSALLAMSLVGCGNGETEADAGVDAGTRTDGGQRRDAGTDRPPPEDVCDPPCGDGMECVSDVTGVPTCQHICNPPLGCQSSTEVCNPVTRACEPITCNGQVCAQGQDCIDLATGNRNTPTAVCTCVPYRVIGGQPAPETDSCRDYGRVCATESDGPPFGEPWTVATCELPGELDECLPTIGCQEGLNCVGVQSDGYGLCLQPCTSTNDCDDIRFTCVDPIYNIGNHCYYNFCADSQAGPVREGFFQPCDAGEGPTSGSCIPLRGTTDSIGICFLNGTSDDGSCDPDANRGSDKADLCPANQLCAGVMPDPEDPEKMVGGCLSLCNAATTDPKPVFACGENERCGSISGNFSHPNTILGICSQTCASLGSEDPDQCSPDAFGNPQSCKVNLFTDPAQGLCVAVHPDAPTTAGEPCVDTADNDGRDRCGGDAQVCEEDFLVNGAPVCVQLCSTARCADTNVDCGDCPAEFSRCAPVNTGNSSHKLGVCRAAPPQQ